MDNTHACPVLTLYTGTDCHLCELARVILDDLVGRQQYREVTITGHPTLCEAYALRIPVVKTAAGKEKSWPFTASQIRRLLTAI